MRKRLQESTTQFIRRRIRHWKTTAAGIAIILCPIVTILWPEFADKVVAIQSLLTGGALIAAADAKPGAETKRPNL
jgi:hypothetical protein